jgi:hypothetical protein
VGETRRAGRMAWGLDGLEGEMAALGLIRRVVRALWMSSERVVALKVLTSRTKFGNDDHRSAAHSEVSKRWPQMGSDPS